MLNLKDILKFLPHASDDDLRKLLGATQKELDVRKLGDLVEYVPNVLDSNLKDEVLNECNLMDLEDNVRKASSQWLSVSNEPYIYPDANPVHAAKDITSFPAIHKAMMDLNKRFGAQNNSCLILKYVSSSTTTRAHADDETNLDQSEPICNLTLGSSRTIDFTSKAEKRNICSIKMEDNGVVVMKPGAQKTLLHAVKGDGKRTHALRYSLSFRTLAKMTSATPGPVVSQSLNSQAAATSSNITQETSTLPTRRVCVVAGDSYAARLETEKLGRKRVVVENIARGGAQIHQVVGQLKTFAAANHDVNVDKICVSVGTNDIRYCTNVEELRPKLKQLCSIIREKFPNSKVYFQLLLPLPCRHQNDWITNQKVIDFNRIIVNECIFRRYHVLDAFAAFRSPYVDPRTPELRNARLFIGSDIHPSKSRGMGVLARLYLRALHSRYFNPFMFQ